MASLANFPLVNQLASPTSDGQPDENARYNCVPASIAAGITYLTGKQVNADELKDAVYGQGYQGVMSADRFVGYAASLGVKLFEATSADQDVLVSDVITCLRSGSPCLVTMPSDWNNAPADPHNPQGFTHVGIACGYDGANITVMNPWGGFMQTQPTAWWRARLCYWAIWPMMRLGGSTVANLPTGWSDDGTVLTGPPSPIDNKSYPVRGGFRDFVLSRLMSGEWNSTDMPLEAEHQYPDTQRVVQTFNWTQLRVDLNVGTIFKGNLGSDFMSLTAKVASLDATVTQLQQQLAAAQAAPPAPATPTAPDIKTAWSVVSAAVAAKLGGQ